VQITDQPGQGERDVWSQPRWFGDIEDNGACRDRPGMPLIGPDVCHRGQRAP